MTIKKTVLTMAIGFLLMNGAFAYHFHFNPGFGHNFRNFVTGVPSSPSINSNGGAHHF